MWSMLTANRFSTSCTRSHIAATLQTSLIWQKNNNTIYTNKVAPLVPAHWKVQVGNSNEPRFEKNGLGGFDLVPHKPGCAATEDS